MKLFTCHAVGPRFGHAGFHIVKTYVVMSQTEDEARSRVRAAEPAAELVTTPSEAPDAMVLTDVWALIERESGGAHSARPWSESRLGNGLPLI